MVQIKVRPTRRRSTGADADNSNRESYLMEAVEILRPLFKEQGAEIPPFHVSVGWPGGRGGLKILGRCWKREASRDGAFQIFVSPVVDDTIQALGILIHELCHACTDCEGHNHEFKALARGLGLDGKLTSTFPSDELTDRLNALVVEKLGKYPHAALTPEKSGEKKQGTRLIKCVCEETGYTVRTTRNWLATYGPPISPKTKKPMRVEGAEATENKTEEEGADNMPHHNLTPEQRAQFEAMGALNTALLKAAGERLVTMALLGMEHGCGASMVLAARSQELPELAAYVIVCTGKYTDDDLARIKEYALASAQDATTGFQSKKEMDTFGKQEGGA